MDYKNEKTLNHLSKIIFIIYIGLLVWVVMFKCNLIDSIYRAYAFMSEQTLKERFLRFIVPFKDYTEAFFQNQIKTLVKDDILNVVIFIPMGLYLSYFFKESKLVKALLITLAISIFFEVFQLLSLLGSFATKDLITNLVGCAIGCLLFLLIYKKENGKTKIMVLNVISTAAILIFAPVLVYGIVNTVINFKIYLDVFAKRLMCAQI